MDAVETENNDSDVLVLGERDVRVIVNISVNEGSRQLLKSVFIRPRFYGR